MNGYGERCGNANLVSILPALQLKMGYECVPAGPASAADRDLASSSTSSATSSPDPDRPYVGRNAFAHKGGMHVAGVKADARTFEHIDPELVGNSRDVLISELSGRGSVVSRAEGAGIDARRRRRQARRRAAQGARAPRLPVRGRGRLVRAPAAARGRRVRAAVPARGIPRDHREARRRQGRDGGDDQDLGRRPALRADRRGQRARERPRPSAARGDHRAASAPGRDRARQLQGAGSWTPTTGPARSRACCSTPPTGRARWGSIGVSENIIEASWEALVDSLEYAFQPRTIPRLAAQPE